MLWVLKRIVSLRQFFKAPKTFVETDELNFFYNFMLNFFVYIDLIGLDKQNSEHKIVSNYLPISFNMFWLLKRTVSSRRFF